MTDNEAAGLREQLINARADLRVKDEQLNSAHALLREKHEQLRIKDEQLRMKDEQLASNDKHYQEQLTSKDERHQEQLRLKDERYDRLLAVKDEQLRVKDEQHHQQILGFVQLGNNFLDKMGGDVNRLKTTHTEIDRYVRHIPPLLTRQPSEKKKHVIVVLAHQEEDGKYETQTIAGQKEYVDRITKHVPEDEFLCEIEDDGNPIDTRNNLTQALRRELSVRTRGRLEAPATKLGNCRSHGHQDELPVEVFAEMLEQLREEHQHGTLVANEYERDRIIDDIKVLINNLFDGIRNHDECKTAFMYALNGINSRVYILYNTYKQTIERFNIGIIAYISDYYSIVDQHSDQFHHKYLHTYSANKNHYNSILSIFNSTKFDIEELVNIFKQHCYEFKRFKFHTDASHLRRTRERTWIIYQNLSNYIASENVYDLSDALMHEFDSHNRYNKHNGDRLWQG